MNFFTINNPLLIIYTPLKGCGSSPTTAFQLFDRQEAKVGRLLRKAKCVCCTFGAWENDKSEIVLAKAFGKRIQARKISWQAAMLATPFSFDFKYAIKELG